MTTPSDPSPAKPGPARRAARAKVSRAVLARRLDEAIRSRGYVFTEGAFAGSLDLARAAEDITLRTGSTVGVNNLRRYVKGEREPTLSIAILIAEGLGFDPRHWFGTAKTKATK